MPNDLDKHLNNVHEQGTQIAAVVDALQENEKSEKERRKEIALWFVIIAICFLVFVFIRVGLSYERRATDSVIQQETQQANYVIQQEAQALSTQAQYIYSLTQEPIDICNGVHVESIEASLIPQDKTSYLYDETTNKSFIPVILSGKMLFNNSTAKELEIYFDNSSGSTDWIRVIKTVDGKEYVEYIWMKEVAVISPNSSAYVDLEAYFFQGVYNENPQINPNGKIQFYIEWDNRGVTCPLIGVNISVGPTKWVEK